MSERELATIRTIDSINPIEGADAIEVATVNGWEVVVKKGEFTPGEDVVYLEIDSWVPHQLAPFLSKGKEPREFENIKGERLRTVKLRGQVSQGLILPLTVLGEEYSDSNLTEFLGIVKWEKPLAANLAGVAKGNFPTHLFPKTDQNRVQNLSRQFPIKSHHGNFEITEKLDGSSMTVYLHDQTFGVCSRNLDLKETEGNSFWEVARKLDIESKMLQHGDNLAIQGELVGSGVQGNKYKFPDGKRDFFVFNVYNIDEKRYLPPSECNTLVLNMGLNVVPVIDSYRDMSSTTIKDCVDMVNGIKSTINPNVQAEGYVFKSNKSDLSFKAINNKWLLKYDE